MGTDFDTKFILDWAQGVAESFATLTGEDLVMTVVEDNSTFTGMADAFARLYPLARRLAAELARCEETHDRLQLLTEAQEAGLLPLVNLPSRGEA